MISGTACRQGVPPPQILNRIGFRFRLDQFESERMLVKKAVPQPQYIMCSSLGKPPHHCCGYESWFVCHWYDLNQRKVILMTYADGGGSDHLMHSKSCRRCWPDVVKDHVFLGHGHWVVTCRLP